ncbi:MAG: hypothetical protein ABH803_03115 [Candidatus Micrarchaeota archaeon]
MGSVFEFNDTLQLTIEQGFPRELVLEKHLVNSFKASDFAGKVFSFKDKQGLRVFHSAPTRVFLVHNINGKRLYWGHCHIIEQTIHAEANTTSGKFIIIKLYSPEHQKAMSVNEVDSGKEFFE